MKYLAPIPGISMFVCGMTLFFGGCAIHPYWTKLYPAIEVEHIVHVDIPCGRWDWAGCWNPLMRTIELSKGMTVAQEACVLSNEKHKADGYRPQPQRAMQYAIDCGDGTMYSDLPKLFGGRLF